MARRQLDAIGLQARERFRVRLTMRGYAHTCARPGDEARASAERSRSRTGEVLHEHALHERRGAAEPRAAGHW